MGLNDYFDKIYCINLDKRTDRWKESTDEFKKWDISGVTRYSAVDGSLLNINTNLLTGEIGILKTHIDILNEAIDNEYGSILLIEDDIMFTDEILSLDKHMSLLPSKWDMIYFGGFYPSIAYQRPGFSDIQGMNTDNRWIM